MSDNVNHPGHYVVGGIETIDVIEAKLSNEGFRGYMLGNVMKYITRQEYKGRRLEDLKKAHWYLTRLIKSLENEHDPRPSTEQDHPG